MGLASDHYADPRLGHGGWGEQWILRVEGSCGAFELVDRLVQRRFTFSWYPPKAARSSRPKRADLTSNMTKAEGSIKNQSMLLFSSLPSR